MFTFGKKKKAWFSTLPGVPQSVGFSLAYDYAQQEIDTLVYVYCHTLKQYYITPIRAGLKEYLDYCYQLEPVGSN